MTARRPKVLVVDDSPDLLEVTTYFLQSQLGADIFEARSFEEATTLIQAQKPDCIVSAAAVDGVDAVSVFTEKTSVGSAVPLVVYCNPDQPLVRGKSIHSVPIEELHEQLSLTVARLIGPVGTSDKEFFPMKIRAFLRLNPVPADLFIQLTSGRYLRVFDNGQQLEFTDLERFLRRGIQELYIRKTDADRIAKAATVGLKALMNRSPRDLKSTIRLTGATVELVADLASRLGFGPAVRDLTELAVQQTLTSILTRPRIDKLLLELKRQHSQPIGAHCVIMAHVACYVAELMDWPSEATFRKLALASLLHDISLRDESFQAIEVSRYPSIEQVNGDSRKMSEFLQHTERAAELIEAELGYVPDLDKIIIQHHERPDGTGFPKHLTHRSIHPLSAVFILAHELVCTVMNQPGPISIRAFVDSYPEAWKHGVFKKVFTALIEADSTTGR